MNKKLLLLMISLLIPFCGWAEELKTHLVVWAKDGTKVAYALEEKPKVTFTETDLVMTTKDIEVNYSLANLDRFTYETSENTAIRDLNTDKEIFKLDGESLLFPALKPQSTVSLHTLNGTQVFSKTVQDSGEYSFPLSNLNAGVYMVTVNGITYKIIKK